MPKITFTLISKKQLTQDVYELVYDCPFFDHDRVKSGQYVLFQLAPWLNRAYSLASYTPQRFTLIIKRIPEGRWSPIICDAPIGTIFSGLLPLGHFMLQDTPVSKCFIGTGTGFAPLYCMMLECSKMQYFLIDTDVLQNQFQESGVNITPWIAFIFWVRELQDVFFSSEIQDIGSRFQNFEYTTYLSREDYAGYMRWYVTDWITQKNISNYQEFYLCGSPAMVKSSREKLETLGVEKERIFWEQF